MSTWARTMSVNVSWPGCYRKMRKFDTSMWMISQTLRDFVSAKAGPAIVRQ